MGEVVAAGLLSHVPTIMLPRETRLALEPLVDFANRMVNGYSQTVTVYHNNGQRHVFSVYGFVRNSAGAITRPVGLEGELMINSFACGVSAALTISAVR